MLRSFQGVAQRAHPRQVAARRRRGSGYPVAGRPCIPRLRRADGSSRLASRWLFRDPGSESTGELSAGRWGFSPGKSRTQISETHFSKLPKSRQGNDIFMLTNAMNNARARPVSLKTSSYESRWTLDCWVRCPYSRMWNSPRLAENGTSNGGRHTNTCIHHPPPIRTIMFGYVWSNSIYLTV